MYVTQIGKLFLMIVVQRVAVVPILVRRNIINFMKFSVSQAVEL